MVARDYNESDEEEAYAVGAAALVPYSSLQRFVITGKATFDIAKHFGVSRELVIYRIKISMMWPEYKKRHAKEVEIYNLKYAQRIEQKAQNEKDSLE